MQLDKLFLKEIKSIWEGARSRAYSLVNREMVLGYWEIGRRIFQEEQKSSKRAEYGKYLLRELSSVLTRELDKSLDERELRRMRQFYHYFPMKDSLRPELTWTHYRLLLRVEDMSARSYYLNEAADHSWGTRHLE